MYLPLFVVPFATQHLLGQFDRNIRIDLEIETFNANKYTETLLTFFYSKTHILSFYAHTHVLEEPL